ncbi:hypothetical protein ACIBI0_38715 [Microbispora rosea]|uniref:hypothetical protein n=1 Tax=Microbispora rosea TaxID=58117 RepID=UPI00378AD49B
MADADHQMEGGPTMANQVESTPTTQTTAQDPVLVTLARLKDLKPDRIESAALLGWVIGRDPELVEAALDAMESRRAERKMEAVR